MKVVVAGEFEVGFLKAAEETPCLPATSHSGRQILKDVAPIGFWSRAFFASTDGTTHVVPSPQVGHRNAER